MYHWASARIVNKVRTHRRVMVLAMVKDPHSFRMSLHEACLTNARLLHCEIRTSDEVQLTTDNLCTQRAAGPEPQ